MTRTIKTQKIFPGTVFVLVVFALTVSLAQAQDAVKLSGLWVQPVKVQSIENGRVRYQIPSGRELARSAAGLEGLKLGRYPGLAQAQQAIDEGDDAVAVVLLQGVMDQAGEPWVRWYAGMRLVQTHARLDDAQAAADVYIDMLMSGAGVYFVAQPPAEVVAQADVAVRLRVLELANTAVGAVGADRAKLLKKLIDATGSPPKNLPADVAVNSNSNMAGSPAQVPVLSASVPPGTVGDLYRKGRYEQALGLADEALSQPGKTASKLYLKGMAQLALAERDGDEAGYKSAGLSFMRVVVYFPRSAVVGPAMLEAGYVHERIGRADIAARLYQKARPMLDEREDPAYYQRLNERIDAVADATTGE
jgi:tetratricopeptide (TPR) repeat protein